MNTIRSGRNARNVCSLAPGRVAKLTISVEEKYEKAKKQVRGQYGDKYDEDSETSSTDEDEDDDGILATEALDGEILATLQAIRNKDPRVYDSKVTFYAPIEEEGSEPAQVKKEKPMYLADYHRQNLLAGNVGEEEEAEDVPKTFAQEQAELKKSIVKEMHAAGDADSEDEEDGGFLIPKSKPKSVASGIHPERKAKIKVADLNVATAEKDPETFLSNFMAARAWVPTDGSRFQPLESDDEEDDERAEKFEAAYNLRFENPEGSNETLKTYARDIIAAKSVRREETNSRKKQRDAAREKKDAEKASRDEDRARLRRLKIEEMEEKLQKIKKAAGISGKTLKDEDWTKFLDDGWEDDKWEEEMNKQFGEDYYATQEAGSDSDDEASGSKKKKKPKKPKWDDDIDIKDLIPDFVGEDEDEKPAFTLTDSEAESDDEDDKVTKKSSKDRQQERQAKKNAARLERKKIEDLVDNHMDVDLPTNSKQPSLFRYRETSPTSFGLTARDILMAPDSQLNQFAGLKKMASFRDPEKKRKDKKHLGKKARLRQWRKETFGDEDGPKIVIGENAGDEAPVGDGMDVDILDGKKKKKKRSRKGRVTA